MKSTSQHTPCQESPWKARASAMPPRQWGDDAPHRLPSKQLSDVETFLWKTCLRLLALGVYRPRELFPVCPTPTKSVDCFDTLSSDRGYIFKDLRECLDAEGINFVYKVRKNMRPLPLSVSDEVFLKKRVMIESVIKELKTQTQVVHTRHRSFKNFQVHVISALIAYTLLENNLRWTSQNFRFP